MGEKMKRLIWLTCAIFLLLVGSAMAAVTAWKTAGTGASVDRDAKALWTAPGNITAEDTSHADCTVGINTYSDWLRASNFGFTAGDIPAGATIDGIEVQYRSYTGTSANVQDSSLYLFKDGSTHVGTDGASGSAWAAPIAYIVRGGAADKWGTTWAQTDIVGNASFGLDFSALNTNATTAKPCYIDVVKIRVYYTAAAGYTGLTINGVAGVQTINGVTEPTAVNGVTAP